MRRVLALVTVAAAVALASPADAKPFTYTDARGDQPADAGLDIVGVKYATEGTTTTTKSGKRTVRTYTPTKLVVSLTTAGVPVQQPGVKYRADAQIESCGNISFTYSNGAAAGALAFSQLIVGCGGGPGTTGGDTLLLDPAVSVKGNSVVWSVSLKSLPKNARVGALLYRFESSVDVTDPAFGLLSPDDFGSAVLDSARSDADWELS